ncbi:maltose/maltodextrin ABC transporter [Vibrio sp. JCM 19236]|nr:maltose/maltodextrin ABC transporter [Vibrio sp. JCM 19236]
MKLKLSLCAAALCCALPSYAVTEGQLTIWINGDKSYEGLAEVGKQFTADTGIPVRVQHPDKPEEKFQQAAANGAGPDIIFWAHDRFGGYAEAGLIKEVKPSKEFKEKLVDFSWDAVSVNGKIMGYPLAIEAPSLIYNKALIKEAPKTWEELVEINKQMQAQGKEAIMWDIKNAYFTWPMISASGAYAFKTTETGYDANDTGVNNAKGVQGLQFLVDMVNQGVVNPDMDYSVAEAEFSKGNVAMTINGPWSWGNLDRMGVDYGVAVLQPLMVAKVTHS